MKLSLKQIFIFFSLSSCFICSKSFGISEKNLISIPGGLAFGAGTSALQIEGALNTHGRSQSYIEHYLSQFNQTFTEWPDISSDSYHRYQEDIKVLKYIGLKFYRFSISWSRLLPTGNANYVNKEAVDYYNSLLDELEKSGIEPMIQLHHFDHPASFEKFGGWQNETMVKLFKDYAKIVFAKFGRRVKYFLTFNEANVFCHFFVSGFLNNEDDGKFPRSYICSHNLLKAHAEVYHLYHDKFNHDGKGMISINLLCNDFIPKENHSRELADVAFEFSCGWFANPIYTKSGDYSDTLKRRVEESNRLRGIKQQLPTFSQSWIERIRGTADFFGVSYYSARVVEAAQVDNPKSWTNFFIPSEARLSLSIIDTWIRTPNNNYIVPKGLRNVLKRINEQYNNPPVYIIENGYSDDGRLNDSERIQFIYAHVKQIIDAMNDDHCNVKAYIYWSLIDNFEFWDGFNSHFGLAHVDFKSPNRTRTLKKSAKWLRNVLLKRQLYIEE